MNRLLIVSVYFPPQGTTGAIRVSQLARHLPEFGYEPVVLTANLGPSEPVESVYPADDLLRRLLDPLRRRQAPGGPPSGQLRASVIPSTTALGRLRDYVM